MVTLNGAKLFFAHLLRFVNFNEICLNYQAYSNFINYKNKLLFQNCKSFSVGKSCCEFICLDDTLNKGDGFSEFGADFGLRLIVSAIAAILSLCLLFFLVHRLRQRKIRGK